MPDTNALARMVEIGIAADSRRSGADRLAAQETEPLPAPELTDDALDIIARLYAADFERFGYDPEKPEPSPAAANPTA